MPTINEAMIQALGKSYDGTRLYSLVSERGAKTRPASEGWRQDGTLTYGPDTFMIYSRPAAAPPKEPQNAPRRRYFR